MRGSFRFLRVAGIDLRVHYTFPLVLIYGAVLWSGPHGLNGALFGCLLMLALFACVVLHELGHSLVARRLGIPVREIVLLPIGGMALMVRSPRRPLHELLIAAAGPAVSGLLAVAFYGLLTASLDIGSFIAATCMVTLPAPTRTGEAMLLSVVAYGVATMAFGLSTLLPLSIVLYAAVGAADQVSVVMRQNTIQLAIPDDLRGRVTAVNFVFVNASNQIGGLESGLVAAVSNAVFAVVSGGAACLVVAGIIGTRVPQLRAYRAQHALD